MNRSDANLRLQNIAALDGSFKLSEADMRAFDALNIGWRHLLYVLYFFIFIAFCECDFANPNVVYLLRSWTETSAHPDYPFHSDLPYNFVLTPASGATSKSGRE
jgi:hypothetical protein